MDIEYREQNAPPKDAPPEIKRDILIDGQKIGHVSTGGWNKDRHAACISTYVMSKVNDSVLFVGIGETADEAVVNAVKAGIRLIEVNTPIINELKAKFGL